MEQRMFNCSKEFEVFSKMQTAFSLSIFKSISSEILNLFQLVQMVLSPSIITVFSLFLRIGLLNLTIWNFLMNPTKDRTMSTMEISQLISKRMSMFFWMSYMMLFSKFSEIKTSFFSLYLRRLLRETMILVENRMHSFFQLIWMMSSSIFSDSSAKLIFLLDLMQQPLNQLYNSLRSNPLFSLIYLNILRISSMVWEQVILRTSMKSSPSFSILKRKMKFSFLPDRVWLQQLRSISSSKLTSMFSRSSLILKSLMRLKSLARTGGFLSMQASILQWNFLRRRHRWEREQMAERQVLRDLMFFSFGDWMNLAVMISKFLNLAISALRTSQRTLSSRRRDTRSCLYLMAFSLESGCSKLALSILVPPCVRHTKLSTKQLDLLLVSPLRKISSSRMVWDSMMRRSSSRCHLILRELQLNLVSQLFSRKQMSALRAEQAMNLLSGLYSSLLPRWLQIWQPLVSSKIMRLKLLKLTFLNFSVSFLMRGVCSRLAEWMTSRGKKRSMVEMVRKQVSRSMIWQRWISPLTVLQMAIPTSFEQYSIMLTMCSLMFCFRPVVFPTLPWFLFSTDRFDSAPAHSLSSSNPPAEQFLTALIRIIDLPVRLRMDRDLSSSRGTGEGLGGQRLCSLFLERQMGVLLLLEWWSRGKTAGASCLTGRKPQKEWSASADSDSDRFSQSLVPQDCLPVLGGSLSMANLTDLVLFLLKEKFSLSSSSTDPVSELLLLPQLRFLSTELSPQRLLAMELLVCAILASLGRKDSSEAWRSETTERLSSLFSSAKSSPYRLRCSVMVGREVLMGLTVEDCSFFLSPRLLEVMNQTFIDQIIACFSH